MSSAEYAHRKTREIVTQKFEVGGTVGSGAQFLCILYTEVVEEHLTKAPSTHGLAFSFGFQHQDSLSLFVVW